MIIIIMMPDATREQLRAVFRRVTSLGYSPYQEQDLLVSLSGVSRIIFVDAQMDAELLEGIEEIQQVFSFPQEPSRPLPMMA